MAGYDDLLKAIGFGAADANNQFDLINRKLALGQSDINREGDLSRRGLLSSQEGNGVLNSGETGLKLADQASAQASQLSGLSLSAADDASSVQRSILQQQAAAQAQAAQLAEQKREFDAQQAAAQAQLDIAKQGTPVFDPSSFFGNGATNGTGQPTSVLPNQPAPNDQTKPGYRKNGGY